MVKEQLQQHSQDAGQPGTAPEFQGTRKQQAAARETWDLLRARGRFMSTNAPIRASLASLEAFFAQDGKISAADLKAALAANPTVFGIEDVDGESVIATSREGRSPAVAAVDTAHSFAQRFLTPLPKPERPPQPVRERVRVDPSWATIGALLGGLDLEPEEADEVDDVEPAATPQVADESPVAEVTDSTTTEVAPEAVVPATRTIIVSAAPTDVTGVADPELYAVIGEHLRGDPRVANFADHWMAEERVPRFTRGDLRRMKDYIQEREQPATDGDLLQDVLGTKRNAPDFESLRFAVNFRLSREHREFDFVGTADQRFWSTANLAQIGTTRRKPNELGTDYRFLLDEVGDLAPRSAPTADHVLTFYEYYHGLLPYDANLHALLPGPILPNQRSAVLTFECPQSYTTYLVELRYPTPNRGGFILGLDDFYSENLVPGAMISISRTDNDGHYLVEYVAAGTQNARLLELDERRAPRYVFRPTSYACGVDEDMLLTEERYPRLAGERPLDEKRRRRPESVIATTFERVGAESDGGFSVSFNELLASVNIERPFSEQLLRSSLDRDETGAFARDPDGSDVYTYVPSTRA